ncbi:MAG: endonuclease III domain-containing protein [Acidobacteriia bacterium]|nr:endonuclease III domain-containing protein [Terriglobia bacterium]
MVNQSAEIVHYYGRLLLRWGPQNWWPAESRLEVIVGAYLTQNTNWSNVEKAIANLRRARVLSVKGLREIPLARLQKLVRPSGYFRQKAQKLKTFIRYLDENYGGSLDRMFAQPTEKLRAELLALNGVGPETADSILLYAGNHHVFVVDAYTHRVFERHGIIPAKAKYEEIRLLVEQEISGGVPDPMVMAEQEGAGAKPESLAVHPQGNDLQGNDPRHPVSRISSAARSELAQHYNELHALIVRVGNQYCRKTAKCEECPLKEFLPRKV